MHEHTARFIRRGYPLHVFEQTAHTLHTLNIPVIVHVILGLPGETEADILETIQYLNTQHIQGIKLQLLHVLKGTDLAVYLEEHPWHILTQEEYVDLVIQCIGQSLSGDCDPPPDRRWSKRSPDRTTLELQQTGCS